MWTQTTFDIHGVPPGYVPDVTNAIQFYAPEARPVITKAIEDAVNNAGAWDLELPFIDYTGKPLWVRAVGQVVIENGKAVALEGAFTDITAAVGERKRLALEGERLAMILHGTDAGTWEWNAQTGETRCNERWAEIVGHTLDTLGPVSIQTWIDLAHPEDLDRSNAALQRHFIGETPRYECEARMRHRDGHWVWVLDCGRVMTRTPDGKPEWMFGTHLDITERKQAELRLAESEALLSTTLHSIGDAVLTADADARVTWINPVAEALTGWSNEDARGRLAAEVLHLEIEGREGRAPCPVRACLDEGRKVGLAGSTVLVSRRGARYVIEDSAAPLREAGGPVRGVVLVFHDVTEKARLATEMSYRATHDALTGLVNRAELESTLEDALARVRKRETEGALMFIDLDHFKVVNDACGHAAGDRLLVQIAALLRAGVRARDVVARFGGDEFAILLEDCPLPRAQAIAEKILEAVDAYRFVSEDGRRFRVGMSVGMVPVDKRWINLAQLVQGADAACYAAKSEGRGRVVVDQGVLQIGATQRRDVTWGPLIEQALDEDLFELYAQRVVPLRNDLAPKLRCEVLLRLRGGDGRMVSPAEFIPAAERYQLASRIDRWVLRHVLRVLSDVPLAGIGRVAVNLSGQSVGDRAFHRFAVQAIAESGLPPEVLCVEITETAVVTNFADAARFIDDLRALGVQVALDDFGAGASSFGYLKSLSVDVLKIDGQFVRGLLQGQLEAAALRSFVDVAGVLGLRTVAEQVETESVAARLVQLGVDFGQGYHFHRPEPIGDLLRASANESQRVARLKLVAPDDSHR
jgi:diguanylate cyclase (GGDEF)-like protein/PAS domain S-box-containing protein